jgi:hypothetical protein
MSQYTPPNPNFNNNSANAIGSFFGAFTGRDKAFLQRKVFEKIVDSAPKQFYDLKLLLSNTTRPVSDDEFEWFEAPYDRFGFGVAAASAAVNAPTTQLVQLSSVDNVTENLVLTYPNGKQGTVIAINSNTNQITVAPQAGDSLPALGAGDILANTAPIEGDSSTNISQYNRLNLQRKYNYMSFFATGMRYGFIELAKYRKNNYLPQFLAFEKERMLKNFRISMRNQLWLGRRGVYTLSNGNQVKAMGGILNNMLSNGSPTISTPLSSFSDAVKDALLNTEGGDLGETKYLFATNRRILQLSEQFKTSLTRYTPDDMTAKLNLNAVDIGSSRCVLVPMKAFEDTSSFPVAFQNYAFVLQQDAIKPVKFDGYASAWELKPRNAGGPTMNNFYEMGMSDSLSLEFHHPQYSALITLQ